MTKADIRSPIEDVFSSRGRVRILKVLVSAGELNITEIARRAGLNYAGTNRHLEALRRMGLLDEKSFGKIRIFRYRSEDPRAKAIEQLMNSWQSSTSL